MTHLGALSLEGYTKELIICFQALSVMSIIDLSVVIAGMIRFFSAHNHQ